MVTLLCPVCGQPLHKTEKNYVCSGRHSFDIAKSGYVNLLLNSSQGHHGDDKLMVRARRDFLDKGFYDPLAQEIASVCALYAPQECGKVYERLINDREFPMLCQFDWRRL